MQEEETKTRRWRNDGIGVCFCRSNKWLFC